MVHYLNADMAGNAGNRTEEARFLTNFDEEFGARHQETFAAVVSARASLCTARLRETGDGRLLLFEIGTAMIVHAMDPVNVFPYKKPAMEKFSPPSSRTSCTGRQRMGQKQARFSFCERAAHFIVSFGPQAFARRVRPCAHKPLPCSIAG